MLRSTYKPSGNAPPPLQPGWTEHKAPTGHTYYYHVETKESTYTRPSAATAGPIPPSVGYLQQPAVPQLKLSDPRVANAFMAQLNPTPPPQQGRGGFRDGRGGARGGHQGGRPRPQPVDKPRSQAAIPGCKPWLLVCTKYGRRFAYNPVKNASFWRIPEKLKLGILELDQRRIREKAGIVAEGEREDVEPKAASKTGEQHLKDASGEPEHDFESSEYEEVEVTDDEGEGAGEDGEGDNGDRDGHPPKRQRTEDPSAGDGEDEDGAHDRPVEFDEADIAFQLQAMGEDYGLEAGEYDDGRMEEWPEGAEGVQISEDARDLFKDLLTDSGINPYSPWEKLLEEGRLVEDPRYTVLTTTKARREAWEEWSRERIRALREARARAEKKDPRIAFLAFLQEHATPKLYWPEFRRKYKKEPAMRDTALADRDREKSYRDHVARLKMPPAILKADLTALLRSVPPRELNSSTPASHLPARVLTDLRYISLPPEMRDPLIEALIQTLSPPPTEEGGGDEQAGDDDATRKEKEKRRRRELALQEREAAVAGEKRQKQWQLEYGRARLREEERELERAMVVGKAGLQSQLAAQQGREAKKTA